MEQGGMSDPRIRKKAAQLFAQGKTTQEVADALDCSYTTAYYFRVDNKKIIEDQAQRYLDSLPDIVQHDIDEIKDYYLISKKLRETLMNVDKAGNKDLISSLQTYCNYIDKRITDIKRSIGMYSANSPGLVFQQLNVFNQQTTELSPIISQLLSNNKNIIEDDEDVIDVLALPSDNKESS